MIRLAYYADDFTGATDALESLARAGLRTRLFLDPPTSAECAGLEAVGVAGLTRSLAPAAMEAVLRPAFGALKALAPRHVHYKVCSTFDSSPTVGSIGRAIEVGVSVFQGRTVPLLVAAPALGRYCAFGNLFARFGIGGGGAVHRLDRHPSVSKHPVTPMTEADLRAHLALQTSMQIGLIDVPTLERSLEEGRAALDALIASGNSVILFDGLNGAHLTRVGALIDGLHAGSPLFSVGSSGVGSALTSHWGAGAAPVAAAGRASSPLLVVSGSCSPVTAGQIEWARGQGFVTVALQPTATDHAAALVEVGNALSAGTSVIAYTSLGHAAEAVPAERLGSALGRLAREAVARTGVKRLVVAGGDTSSYAGRALGITSLEFLATLTPGAPLCRARAPDSPADALEIVFKGGQAGPVDFFGKALDGTSSSPR